MQGIKNITGTPPGMYRDGGIIDYHFDLNIHNDGLILYPHFNNKPKAGWFDKSLKRGITPKNYDKVVMITPSAEFVAPLPYGKIPIEQTSPNSMLTHVLNTGDKCSAKQSALAKPSISFVSTL